MAEAMDSRRTQDEVRRLGPWFHNLRLPDGTQTAPEHPFGDFPRFKWNEFARLLPDDLTGWTALDVGCNAGFYTFELARRGARVTGIDLDPRYLRQAEWAAAQFGLQDRVEFRRMQVYDLAREDERRYDLVLFLGVFYHLRYPLLGLDVAARRAARMLVFQTLTAPGSDIIADARDRHVHERSELVAPGWPKMSFIEHTFAGDPTNWWVANRACVEAMLRSTGLRILHRAGDETYVCEPDPANPSCVDPDGWNRSEYLSATGREWRGLEERKVKPRAGTLERLREA